MKAKSYTHGTISLTVSEGSIVNPNSPNIVASIPKSRVKIGFTVDSPFQKFSIPYIPQLASKIYLGKTQMSKCTMRIDVTTTRIVSNKFALHGIQRKQ